MPLWLSQRDALTSQTWRLCSPPSITVLSARIPPHEALLTTWRGGKANSGTQASSSAYPDPNPSSSSEPSQTRALVSAWQSRWAHDGERGDWHQAGSPKGGTSNGLRPLGSNSLQSAYSHYQTMGTTLSSMGTTAGSSRGGGKGAAPTGPPTTFSDASSSLRRIATERYIRDTSQVPKIPPTPHSEASTPHAPSYSTPLSSPARPDTSSSMSDPGELARKTAVRCLVRTRDTEDDPADAECRAHKQPKLPETRPRHLPIPQATTSAARGPAPYLPHLMPTPSSLRPHCLARDRLRRWIPASRPLQPADGSGPSDEERERVKDLMVHAWEEDMRVDTPRAPLGGVYDKFRTFYIYY